jgi:choline kinase
MDADVLYDYRLMARLVESRHVNCFLMDREIEPGEEPVKLCVREGRLVDFHKVARGACDYYGESVGFFRLSPPVAARLAARAEAYISGGRRGEWYEEAIRDELVESEAGTFGFEDVTGLPWIEIDFPEDVARARDEILPRLAAPRGAAAFSGTKYMS